MYFGKSLLWRARMAIGTQWHKDEREKIGNFFEKKTCNLEKPVVY